MEGQGVMKRRRLAAAALVVCVHVCDGVVCRCFYANKADLAGLLYRVVAKWLLHLIHNTHLLTLTLL